MLKITFRVLLCVMMFSSVSYGQRSMKLKKQQTTFFYTQLNLHGGFFQDANGDHWDVANRSPENQIAFQLFQKSKRNMQKGYIKRINPVSYSIRLSLPFSKSFQEKEQARIKLKMLDTWVKFDTKWDRTSFWVGNKSIPYGHNPKLDPVSSFITNLIKMDVGFVQDIGVFLKTPISKTYDLELSLTSGGFLNAPIVVSDDLLSNSDGSNKALSLTEFDYRDTWMVTSRVGNLGFNKNEYGLIGVIGKIANTYNPNDITDIGRLGFDWVYKYYEKMKIGAQMTFGYTDSTLEGNFSTINAQGSADYFLNSKIILSTSLACKYDNSIPTDLYYLNMTNTNSISYTISPHTRFRLNHYFTRIVQNNENQWGVFLQFVTGIGKRN